MGWRITYGTRTGSLVVLISRKDVKSLGRIIFHSFLLINKCFKWDVIGFPFFSKKQSFVGGVFIGPQNRVFGVSILNLKAKDGNSKNQKMGRMKRIPDDIL